jgi:hypothetical protein
MQGLRKMLRTLVIVLLAILGCWLLLDAALNGPGEYQLLVASGMLLVALGLVATWFWSPFG